MKKIKLLFVVLACAFLLSSCKTNKPRCFLVASATELVESFLGK